MTGDYEISGMSSSHLKAKRPEQDLTTEGQPGRASLGNKGVFYFLFCFFGDFVCLFERERMRGST